MTVHPRQVKRPLRDEYDRGVLPFVLQALWSDPSDSDAEMMRGVHPNPGPPTHTTKTLAVPVCLLRVPFSCPWLSSLVQHTTVY